MKKTDDTFRPQRRNLLKAAAGFAGASLLGGLPFRAFAQATDLAPADRCFVFVYFSGGWDQLLAFDPRDPDVFTADRITETRILPGYSLITDNSLPQRPIIPEKSGVARSNIDFGPAVANLANHYDIMSVVRGINMTTLGHEVGYRYFLTGKSPQGGAARGSSTATEIVGQMKPTVPIPSIAYNIETYNDRYPGTANALRVSKTNDLLLTLKPSTQQLDSEIERSLVDFRGQPISCEAAAYGVGGVSATYQTSRDQMKAVLDARLNESLDLSLRGAAYTEQAATRTFYNLTPEGGIALDSPAGRAAMVATALKKGISQCVSINLTGGLDTHFGTQTLHAQRLREGFNALARMVDDLRATPHRGGGSFMDHTTILVFSEFARTPLINSTSGRDHHLSSSCMLMGAGLKHNMVFGKSGDIGMAPGVVDLRTGQPDPNNGENILPEHIIATVLASAKLDYSYMRVEPLRGLLA
jgi:uncharacterized protein (DUF1501 family)